MSDTPAHTAPAQDIEHHVRHVPRLVTLRDIHIRVFGAGAINRLNGRIAVRATSVLSSMWFFWFCVLLDIAELPAVIQAATPVVVVSYISQTVIQLLALPLLGAGQRIIAEAQDARAEADHETLTALHALNVQQLEILRRLDRAGIR
ncbi:MAG TPA: hypothetical protein VIO84_01790 [Candidatus Dormibacteraeota bacterium]|jgi:hypothetical protein